MPVPELGLCDDQAAQEARQTLDLCHRLLDAVWCWLQALPPDLQSPTLTALLPPLERAVHEITNLHADIDLQLLFEAKGRWEHPTQAIGEPRAPFGAVAEACARRLPQAKGKAAKRLQRIHERVQRAHTIQQNARERRLARAAQARAAQGAHKNRQPKEDPLDV